MLPRAIIIHPVIATLAGLAACAHDPLPIDRDLAAHSEPLRMIGPAEGEGGDVSSVELGPWEISDIDLGAEGRVDLAGGDRLERKPFSFQVQSSEAEPWVVTCDVQLRHYTAVPATPERHRSELLECVLAPARQVDEVHWRLRLEGSGGERVRIGEVRRDRPVLDLRSAHAGAEGTIGALAGYEVHHGGRVLAFVEATGERRVWLHSQSPADVSALVASSAVALLTFSKLVSE